MAEVTGDLGGQPIQLNNAATEATLKQLLAAMLAQVAMQNKGTKKDNATQKELEKELTRLAGSANAVTKANDELSKSAKKQLADAADQAKARKKAEELEQQQIKNLQLAGAASNAFANGLEAGIEKLSKTVSTFSNLNSSFTSAASAMSSIPLVGGALATVFGTVAQAGERTYKAFQQASSVGANFGGSINDMIKSATSAGMTFDQFSAVIAKNGESIALLGQGAGDGAKRLAELGSKIRKNPLNADLARLGYSTEDINNGMAQYVGILAKTGKLQGQNDDQLVAGSATYLKNMDELSKLTGKSKDALKAEQDALMNDAAFRLKLAKMDPEGAARLMQYMQTLGPTAQKGMKEYIAFGNATSDHGREFATLMQKSAGGANALSREIQQTGTVSQASLNALDKTYRAEGRAVNAAGISDLYGNLGNSIQQGLVLDNLNTAAQKGNLEDVIARRKAEEDEAKKRAAANAGVKDGLDPAQLQQFQTLIAEINNQLTQMAAQFMPQLESAFKKLADFVKEFIVPVFKYMLDHIEYVIGALVVFKLAALGFKTFLAVKELKASMRGTNAANALYVKDVSGGLGGSNAGGVGGGKDGKGGKGGKGGKVGAIMDVATTALMVGGIGNMVAGPITDSLMDVTGASKELTDEMTAQDSANWARATFWEKLQSGAARGVEKAGDIFGLNKLAERAKVDRIQAETEYLRNKGRDTAGTTTSAGPTTNLAAAGAAVQATEKQTELLTASAVAQTAEIEATEKQTTLLQQELKLQLQAIAAAKRKENDDKTAAFNEKHAQELQRRKAEIEARLAANMKKTSTANEELAKITEKLTEEEKKKLKDAVAPPTSAETKLNFSSPQALFDSFKKKMSGGSAEPTVAPPSGVSGGGASSSAIGTGLGAVAEKYESAGRGSGTVGYDKSGGTSYGKKQISSKAGAMTDYLKFLEKTGKGDVAKQLREAGIEKDTGSTSGKAVDVWKKLAAEGALGNSENEFIGQGYGVAKKGIKDKDLQARIDGSRGLQEMLYSTAVQHGPSGAMAIINSVFKKGMSDEDLVKAVYKERGADGGKKHFTKSTDRERAGVVNRFGKEEQDIMSLLKNPPSAATASTSSTAMPNVATASNLPTTAATPDAQTASSAITPTALAATTVTEVERAAQTQSVQLANANRPGTGAPGAGGGSPMNEVVAQLEMLNNKIASLVRINNDALNVGQNQLRAAREASGNLFMA